MSDDFDRGKFMKARSATIVALAVGAVAASGSIISVVLLPELERKRAREEVSASPSPRLERRREETERRVEELRAEINALGDTPSRGRLAAEVAGIRRRVRALASDQAALREVLAPDPVKALKVALLQRDLKSSQATAKASVDAVRADIERQYDLMKFVVGTLGLGLLAVIASVAVPAIRDLRAQKADEVAGERAE